MPNPADNLPAAPTEQPRTGGVRPMEDDWTARADWIEAEDGTIVAMKPPSDLPNSTAMWPQRRPMIAAAPQMLAALRDLMTIRPENWNDGEDPDLMQAYGAAERAIAAAEGR